MKRKPFGVGVCFAFLLTAVACNKPSTINVAATVNGRPVNYADLDRAMAAQFPNAPLRPNDDQTTQVRLNALQALIDSEILLQRSGKEGLLASDSEVEAKFNEYKTPYTQEQFQKLLTQRRMSTEDFKAQIRRELSVEKLRNKEIGSHIAITDADVAAFYNANKASFNLPENQVHLAQILVTPAPDPNVHNLKNDKAQNDEQARAKIQMIQMRLRQGEDFAALAQNYSEDANSAPNGGDFGFIGQSQLEKVDPGLRKMVMDLNPGQVSPIIRTSAGYSLFRLISKEPAGQRELKDPNVEENIRRELFQRKDQVLQAAFYEVARSEAKVVNYYARSVLASRDKK